MSNSIGKTAFNDVPFGSSRRQIEDAEGHPPVQSKQDNDREDLVYLATVQGHAFTSIYSLVDDAFAFGQYLLSDDFDDVGEYADVYRDLQDNLIQAYGEPSAEEVVGSKKEMQRINVYGETVWEGTDQQIRLQCFKDAQWTVQVIYEDKALSPVTQQ